MVITAALLFRPFLKQTTMHFKFSHILFVNLSVEFQLQLSKISSWLPSPSLLLSQTLAVPVETDD
jgi:hypothetical protein